MLRLIPRPLARALYRLAHDLRVVWWRVAKPRLDGCRVIALDSANRVLLVRHTYGTGRWMPPGGGLGRGEDALQAAARELAEETGCTLLDAVLIDEVEEMLHGARNRVRIVAGRVSGKPCVDGREVAKAALFRAERLPDDMPRQFRKALPGWITAATVACPADGAAPPSPPAPTA
ncbi:MAG TPA: NUDIX domain-containing protein [Novosphingobium sp.]|nr:NUDIX domain-containing protein [Novosphingobium sp.]